MEIILIIGAVILAVLVIGLRITGLADTDRDDTPRAEYRRRGPPPPRLKNANVRSEIIAVDGETRYSLTLTADEPLLPRPLEISYGGGDSPSVRIVVHDRVLLQSDDFESVHRSLAGERLNDALRKNLGVLRRNCVSFSIRERFIHCLVNYEHAAAETLKTVYSAMAGTASGFGEIDRTRKWAVKCMCGIVLNGRDPADRLACLRFLVEFHKNEEPVKLALERLTNEAEFDLAFPAVEGLGLDAFAFARERAARFSPANRAKAVRAIAEKKMAGGLDFLLGVLPDAAHEIVRIAIVSALGQFADRRAEPLLIGILRSSSGELTAAALHALAACGGRDSLEPLYAVSVDPSLPKTLRDAAREAASAIRERLGKIDTGLVSLAADSAGEGGLSLTGGESAEGGLAAAGDDAAPRESSEF